jgi:hypothetical protein
MTTDFMLLIVSNESTTLVLTSGSRNYTIVTTGRVPWIICLIITTPCPGLIKTFPQSSLTAGGSLSIIAYLSTAPVFPIWILALIISINFTTAACLACRVIMNGITCKNLEVIHQLAEYDIIGWGKNKFWIRGNCLKSRQI